MSADNSTAEKKNEADSNDSAKLPSLYASGIAEYIRFDCCPRYFKLKFEGKTEEHSRKWPEAFKPLSPLLYGAGRELEAAKVAELKQKAADYHSFDSIDTKRADWDPAWRESLRKIREIIEHQLTLQDDGTARPVLLYQVPMTGHIGVWELKGLADLIGIWPSRNGKVKVKIFEIKASWKEQTAHRIQVAIYALLLSRGLEDLGSGVDIEGGVINKDSDLTSLTYDSLPSFRLKPLIQDVERLLCKEGELYRIHKTPLPEVEYQLCWRCDTCGFNECCIIRAVENESISLLNLTRGEQHALEQYGIRKLEDLARLKFVPDSYSQKPYNFKEIPARETQKVKALSSDLIIGPKLDRIIQRAQFMLGWIRPSSPYVNKTRWMPWLTGTGYGGLPEDSPQEGTNRALLFKPDGMIRVYFHIQWDYMLDVLSMLSARVSCTRYRGESISISKVIRSLPDTHEKCVEEERLMMEEFFSEVTKAINKVASEVESPDEAPIHLYFYTQHERDILMEAVRRQPSLMSAQAVRDLLGLRQAIDQPMFSIVQNEVMLRKAAGYHSTGLLPVLEQACYFDRNNWNAIRQDGSRADLRRIFHYGFFNFSLPYTRSPDGEVSFILGFEDRRRSDGHYPARARFGNQIPIEYVWAAKGRLNNHNEKGWSKLLIEKRMWADYPQKTRRITEEELTLLGSRLCLALECIERSLSIRNRRLGKKPIAVPKIAEFTLGAATLERSCREFLDLEYFAKRQELYQHYALLPYQRVATGRSVIFECTDVEEVERDFIVRGKLVYEGIGLQNVDCTANACRLKGSDSSGSGDWLVVTEVKRNEQGLFEEAQERSPSEVEKSARAIVDTVNLRKMQITIKVLTWPSGKHRKYSAWHNLPTTDPEKASRSRCHQLFEAGRTYILDELADDIISERAVKCLDYIDSNALYRLLTGFLAGKTEPSEYKALPKASAEAFLQWAEQQRRFPPKPEQKEFINRIFGAEQIVLLQGPPGTGKTESLQLAVLAHIAAHKAGGRCRVLMVAPTHKAIHEFVSKLADSWLNYCREGNGGLADLSIYRVLSSDVSGGQTIDGVKYLNYNEDKDAVEELRDSLVNQGKLLSNSADLQPLILCVTPPGMYGLMKKIGEGEPPWGEGFFDLLAVDEASMMRLPELILSGAFIKKNAQILVAGDHRQLPPIQAHNWEKEDRRTIEEMASFLSAQDFLRLLRQEDLGREHVKCKNKADIPAERLSESHRCHQVVAEFLREWVYKNDGIDFRSDQTETLPPSNPQTAGLGVTLKPENVFVLVVHDEAESFQSNMVEAKIIESIVRNSPCDAVGIVTPHNAQRGLIKNLLSDGFGDVRVDTVERYQGGEGDFIVISSTVSDPDYVRGESDFLLNMNRINVAVSRMKKKLIIVASKSIFQFMPQDARDYDKALLWRGIAETVEFTANSTPKWSGTLTEFTGQKAPEVKVEVYAKSK
ncbi:MAG: AAA domain-containing protein [Candidatus Bathyarchaeota archaeon]|nr:AAA domain-containing protein [Candidatus Bathyarchaeota archaeon]